MPSTKAVKHIKPNNKVDLLEKFWTSLYEIHRSKN